MRFTARYVENLKPKDKRFVVYEDSAHGNGSLGMRVTPNGTKSWVHLYLADGKRRMVTLGRYPAMTVAEAHEAFAQAARRVAEGGDPGAAVVEDNLRRRKAPRVRDLAEVYIDKWAKPRKRSWRQDLSILEKDVLPFMGHLRLEDVKRRTIVAMLDKVVARGAPVQANRVLALVRKMFNFAVGRDMMEHNPCSAIPRPSEERRRHRVLAEEELKTLFAKLPSCEMWSPTQLALCFLLTTAQRPGEVVGTTWDEIDRRGRM